MLDGGANLALFGDRRAVWDSIDGVTVTDEERVGPWTSARPRRICRAR